MYEILAVWCKAIIIKTTVKPTWKATFIKQQPVLKATFIKQQPVLKPIFIKQQPVLKAD
jgi:hypothetical protein